MQTADHLKVPMVITEQYPKGLGGTVPDLKVQSFQAPVFAKTQFSMLAPEVVDHLRSLHADTLAPDQFTYLLCGIEAHVCVLQTALDLRDRGARVQILADATSSRHPFERSLAFDRMKTAGCQLTTVESAAFQLMADATHPKFKQIQTLFITERPETGLDGTRCESK